MLRCCVVRIWHGALAGMLLLWHVGFRQPPALAVRQWAVVRLPTCGGRTLWVSAAAAVQPSGRHGRSCALEHYGHGGAYLHGPPFTKLGLGTDRTELGFGACYSVHVGSSTSGICVVACSLLASGCLGG